MIKDNKSVCKKKSTIKRHHITQDSQEKIDKCLNCTKPESECKGKCF